MYLGIDIGTSGVKVVLTDNGSNIIGSETSDLKVVRKILDGQSRNQMTGGRPLMKQYLKLRTNILKS